MKSWEGGHALPALYITALCSFRWRVWKLSPGGRASRLRGNLELPGNHGLKRLLPLAHKFWQSHNQASLPSWWK